MSQTGGPKFWNAELHKEGFMGVVDKTWILMQRIGTILTFISIIFAIIGIVFATSAKKESFSMFRNVPARY